MRVQATRNRPTARRASSSRARVEAGIVGLYPPPDREGRRARQLPGLRPCTLPGMDSRCRGNDGRGGLIVMFIESERPLWDRVVSPGPKGPAAADPPEAQPQALRSAVADDGLAGVVRTTGEVPASAPEVGGQGDLVYVYCLEYESTHYFLLTAGRGVAPARTGT